MVVISRTISQGEKQSCCSARHAAREILRKVVSSPAIREGAQHRTGGADARFSRLDYIARITPAWEKIQPLAYNDDSPGRQLQHVRTGACRFFREISRPCAQRTRLGRTVVREEKREPHGMLARLPFFGICATGHGRATIQRSRARY